jgi:hypothetical protein
MELNNFNVRELTIEEQITTNGGSKVGDFLAAAWETIQVVYELLRDKFLEWYEKRMAAIEAEKMELTNLGLM